MKKLFNNFIMILSFVLMVSISMGSEVNEAATKKLLGTVKNNKIDEVRTLLDSGADVNTIDKKGYTAIMYALENDNLDMIKIILKYKPDLGLVNAEGNMPLMIANSPEAVNMLVEAGARIDKFNEKRNNPLLNAARKKDIKTIEALLKNGAKTEIRNSRNQTPLLLAIMDKRVDAAKILIKHSFIDNRDKEGNTALMYATDEDIIIALLEQGTDMKMKNNKGVVIGEESFMLCIEMGYKKAIEKFIEKGKSVNFKDAYGDTPLLYAVKKNQVEIAEMLLKAGANINIKDSSGKTAIQIAVGKAMKDMVNLLIKYGAEI